MDFRLAGERSQRINGYLGAILRRVIANLPTPPPAGNAQAPLEYETQRLELPSNWTVMLHCTIWILGILCGCVMRPAYG